MKIQLLVPPAATSKKAKFLYLQFPVSGVDVDITHTIVFPVLVEGQKGDGKTINRTEKNAIFYKLSQTFFRIKPRFPFTNINSQRDNY